MKAIYFEVNIPKVLLTKSLRPIWPKVIYSGLSPVRFEDIKQSTLPRSDFVRVRNLLSGICASDLHLLFAEAEPSICAAALPGKDRIYLGHEIFGEISEVGSSVTKFKVGDRVIFDKAEPDCIVRGIDPPCQHCQANNNSLCENIYEGNGIHGFGGGWGDEYVAHESNVYPIPDEMDDDTAVLVEPLSVGVRTVLRKLPGPNEKILIIGAGMIGLAAVWAARKLSPHCHITVYARYPQQVALAQKLGANEVFVPEDTFDITVKITEAKRYSGLFNNHMLIGGFDVIYDSVGSSKTVHESLRMARAGGTVVLAGIHLGQMKLDLSPVWYQEVDLKGVFSHGGELMDGKAETTYDLTTRLLKDDGFPAQDFITHRFSLERWKEAVEAAADKRSGAIKVLFEF